VCVGSATYVWDSVWCAGLRGRGKGGKEQNNLEICTCWCMRACLPGAYLCALLCACQRAAAGWGWDIQQQGAGNSKGQAMARGRQRQGAGNGKGKLASYLPVFPCRLFPGPIPSILLWAGRARGNCGGLASGMGRT